MALHNNLKHIVKRDIMLYRRLMCIANSLSLHNVYCASLGRLLVFDLISYSTAIIQMCFTSDSCVVL